MQVAVIKCNMKFWHDFFKIARFEVSLKELDDFELDNEDERTRQFGITVVHLENALCDCRREEKGP